MSWGPSWQPEAVTNNRIRIENNLKTNWEYRGFLTANASNIIKTNYDQACKGKKQRFASNQQAYSYENSDLRNMYLESHDLAARSIAPTIVLREN